jgi:hypothetical protein
MRHHRIYRKVIVKEPVAEAFGKQMADRGFAGGGWAEDDDEIRHRYG